jgi:hypothetical protein
LFLVKVDCNSIGKVFALDLTIFRRPFILLLEIKDNKLCLKQRVEIQLDVLSLYFDANSDLWMSHGSTQVGKFDEEIPKERISVSRFSAGSYSAVSSTDEITKKINQLELRPVIVEVDHYELSKGGKKEIKKKDELEQLRKNDLRLKKMAARAEAQEESKKKKKLEIVGSEVPNKKQKIRED